MTDASAQAFWTRVAQDTEFRTRLAAAANDQELEQIIRNAGFAFTAEDMHISLEKWKLAPVDGHELSETELEAVAGGTIAWFRGGLDFFVNRRLGAFDVSGRPVFKG